MLAKLGTSLGLSCKGAAISLFLICAHLPQREVIAVSLKTVSAAQAANGTVTISVWAGVGQNIFIPKGEKIQKVWLDDPSRITLDFDTSLCSSGNNNCDGSGASVIHLKRIHPLNFEQLPKTASTLLTVITDKNRYLFRLTYGTGNPQYYAVEIYTPPSQIDLDLVSFQTSVEKGLAVAQEKGLIDNSQKNTALVGRVRNFLFLHKSGLSLVEAATNAGVSIQLINKLAQMGQSSLSYSSEINIDTPVEKTTINDD